LTAKTGRIVYDQLDRILHAPGADTVYDGYFFCLSGNLQLNSMPSIRILRDLTTGIQRQIRPSKRERHFTSHISKLSWQLQTVIVISEKIDYLTEQKADGTLSDDAWAMYIQTDIHAFHLELRALYDLIAQAIDSIAEKPGQLPGSFHALRSLCNRNRDDANKRIGYDLVEVIRKCDWFDHFRDVRDSIVHYGKSVEVKLLLPNDIICQTDLAKGDKKIISTYEEFMWRNWILFRPYAGYHLAMLIDLLNSVAIEGASKLNLEPYESIKWTANRSQSALAWMTEASHRLRFSMSHNFAYEQGWLRIFKQNQDTADVPE
jgi:hypothetical protein